MVQGRIPQEQTQTVRTNKWEPRWRRGLWLGKLESSDEHIIFSGTTISRYRCIRRYAAPDPLRWDLEMIQRLTCTPWNLTGGDP